MNYEVDKKSYSDIFTNKKKILIVGPYPPPLGGVSVHIYRLIKLLEGQKYLVKCFDTSKKQSYKGQKYLRLFFYLLVNKYKSIHIHENDLIVFRILILLKSLSPKIEILLTNHNLRLFDNRLPNQKQLINKFLYKIDTLIVVGKHILDEYKTNNVNLPKRVFVKNAFIEPPLSEEKTILNTYPQSIFKFLDSHYPILTANAFQISFYKGIDLYGLDMCIELIVRLKQKYPNIGFIFALANSDVNQEYLENIKNKLIRYNVQKYLYILSGQKELWPLLKKTDLMIRPTVTDGDAISIRESLFFNIPAIASNVCKRPDKTVLFRNRDINDLEEKCLLILQEGKYIVYETSAY